ncbi:hypothetical protein J5N97_009624 [Dioscorea zingiberensis]|uniref:Uncharacterized protein n=1 Tax=Dioscorea zingiberensis TaxID=325984 RepID=A0A9D5CYL8_9LILI|nr:hypothetical protein J5N97_009624 [Dioscorea zingiberensis]
MRSSIAAYKESPNEVLDAADEVKQPQFRTSSIAVAATRDHRISRRLSHSKSPTTSPIPNGTVSVSLDEKNRAFFVTALIIPKQESTSDSYLATNEEEIFDYQDKLSLFPLGWIHIMLLEAIAIVMAPRDGSRYKFNVSYYLSI